MAKRHLIGLLLATEEDWPTAFETVLARLGTYRRETHKLVTERLKNEPYGVPKIGSHLTDPHFSGTRTEF